MKILVVGNDEFLRPCVLRALEAVDADVSTTHPDQLEAQAGHWDVVIHLALTTGEEARAALDVFAGHAARLVVTSSDDVYAASGALFRRETRTPSSVALAENAPPRTSRFLYNNLHESLDVENVLLAAAEKIPPTILRLPILFGPNDDRFEFFPFVRRMEEGRPAILLDPAFGNFRRAHAYVENVAHAIALATTNPAATGRIYNVGEAPFIKTLTTAERLHALADIAKYRGKIIVVPRDRCPPHLLRPLDYSHDLVLDNGAIRRELGYAEPVSSRDALSRTYAWQRTLCPIAIDAAAYDYGAEDAVLADFGLLPKQPRMT